MKKSIEVMPKACKFFYHGSHEHPVRRTVLLIEETPKYIRGYELRSGRDVRTLKEAKRKNIIRTYTNDKIAKMGDYCRLRKRKDYKSPDQTTLRNLTLLELMEEGV